MIEKNIWWREHCLNVNSIDNKKCLKCNQEKENPLDKKESSNYQWKINKSDLGDFYERKDPNFLKCR